MMRNVIVRSARGAMLLLALLSMPACQSPSDPDDDLDVDDFVDATATPNPTVADGPTGKMYRVVIGNNQPDEFREYDWRTQFVVAVTLNNNAASDDLDLNFPVDLSSVAVKVQQASGGIVNPPTGGDVEKFESTPSNASGNQFGGANQTITMLLDVWYDLPSLRKEALITVTLNFTDDDGTAFAKNLQVRVAP